MKKTDFNILDPLFTTDLKILVGFYTEHQKKLDKTKWEIACVVNENYSEHKSIFAGDKMAYYAECSRVANDGLSIKIMGESGQTLRRWCEVAAAYENFPQAELLLDETSFKHLSVAKRAAKQEKAASPIAAMDWALAMGASADDMQEHYFPASAPTEYDVIDGSITHMLNPKNWDWIKSADVKDTIIGHVRAIDTIRREYLESEGKATLSTHGLTVYALSVERSINERN